MGQSGPPGRAQDRLNELRQKIGGVLINSMPLFLRRRCPVDTIGELENDCFPQIRILRPRARSNWNDSDRHQPMRKIMLILQPAIVGAALRPRQWPRNLYH
jgi:hypothetical protein